MNDFCFVFWTPYIYKVLKLKIQWLWVQIPLRPIFYSYFKNASVVNTIYIDWFRYERDYLCEISLKYFATDEGNGRNEMWTLDKTWNWSSCRKLALSASWTHGLIAQSARASERNAVMFKSHSGQFFIATSKILQWWIPYVYIYILYTYI